MCYCYKNNNKIKIKLVSKWNRTRVGPQSADPQLSEPLNHEHRHTPSVHVFAEARAGAHMRPAKAVLEFTQTNRKSSVKSGKEGRGFWRGGGAGEEFGIDFHSAFPAAPNLQREREGEGEGRRGRAREREGEGGKMQSGHCCAEGAAVSEAAVALGASEMSIKTWVVFRFDGGALGAQRSGRGRGSLRPKAHAAAHRPLKSFKCVHDLVSMIRVWPPLNYRERTAKKAGDSSAAAADTVTPGRGSPELDSSPLLTCHLRRKSRRTKRLLPNMRPKWKVGDVQACSHCCSSCEDTLLRNLATEGFLWLPVRHGVGQILWQNIFNMSHNLMPFKGEGKKALCNEEQWRMKMSLRFIIHSSACVIREASRFVSNWRWFAVLFFFFPVFFMRNAQYENAPHPLGDSSSQCISQSPRKMNIIAILKKIWLLPQFQGSRWMLLWHSRHKRSYREEKRISWNHTANSSEVYP